VIVDTVVSELAKAAGVVVLVIDDLHELSSADAAPNSSIAQLLPEPAHVVLSSRRDPPIKLHQLRLAGEVAELRASDLRFSVSETRQLLAASGSRLSEAGRPRCTSARRVGRLACAWP
jgi:LuxR family maltose regulon positive regulatory protein